MRGGHEIISASEQLRKSEDRIIDHSRGAADACWCRDGELKSRPSSQGLWGRRKDADVKDGKFLDLGAETNSGDGRGSPPGGAVGSPRARWVPLHVPGPLQQISKPARQLTAALLRSKGRAADVGNFVVSGLTGKTVLRTAGQIAGQQFVVQVRACVKRLSITVIECRLIDVFVYIIHVKNSSFAELHGLHGVGDGRH